MWWWHTFLTFSKDNRPNSSACLLAGEVHTYQGRPFMVPGCGIQQETWQKKHDNPPSHDMVFSHIVSQNKNRRQETHRHWSDTLVPDLHIDSWTTWSWENLRKPLYPMASLTPGNQCSNHNIIKKSPAVLLQSPPKKNNGPGGRSKVPTPWRLMPCQARTWCETGTV